MPDPNAPTLAEAVDAAIAEVTPAATIENDDGDLAADTSSANDSGAGDAAGAGGDGAAGGVDTGGTEGDDGAGTTGDDPAGGEGEVDDGFGDVDENDPAAVKAAEDAGRTRDPKTGKFTKAVAETPEQKAAKEAAAAKTKPAAKAADPVNDPIPKELNRKTQERIRTLVDTVKKADEKVAKAVDDRDYLLNRIQLSTATPEQYNQTLEIVRQMNSNDPAEQKKALEQIQATAAELAKRLGVVLPGVDVLSQHPELKAEVEAGHISRARAEEMAAMRNAQTYAAQTREQQAAVGREETARVAAVSLAKTALNTLENQLRGADPNYEAKKEILTKTLQSLFKELHPSKWATAFQNAYNALPASAVAPRPAPRSVAPANQPLRAKQASGGQVRAASSALEAMNGALASMPR